MESHKSHVPNHQRCLVWIWMAGAVQCSCCSHFPLDSNRSEMRTAQPTLSQPTLSRLCNKETQCHGLGLVNGQYVVASDTSYFPKQNNEIFIQLSGFHSLFLLGSLHTRALITWWKHGETNEPYSNGKPFH